MQRDGTWVLKGFEGRARRVFRPIACTWRILRPTRATVPQPGPLTVEGPQTVRAIPIETLYTTTILRTYTHTHTQNAGGVVRINSPPFTVGSWRRWRRRRRKGFTDDDGRTPAGPAERASQKEYSTINPGQGRIGFDDVPYQESYFRNEHSNVYMQYFLCERYVRSPLHRLRTVNHIFWRHMDQWIWIIRTRTYEILKIK